MGIGDLDSGARFGLVPIGLPESNLTTPGSDTERRAMPGLATKNSVFSWVGAPITIVSRAAVTGTFTDTINLRNNTATGGSSLDVPTWAAGVDIRLDYTVIAMGSSNYHVWGVSSPVVGNISNPLLFKQENAVKFFPGGETVTVLVPFYDEPIVIVYYATDGTGTGTYSARVIGFVRNV